MILSEENIKSLETRKEELLSQQYTQTNSHIVEMIDVLLGKQD